MHDKKLFELMIDRVEVSDQEISLQRDNQSKESQHRGIWQPEQSKGKHNARKHDHDYAGGNIKVIPPRYHNV